MVPEFAVNFFCSAPRLSETFTNFEILASNAMLSIDTTLYPKYEPGHAWEDNNN